MTLVDSEMLVEVCREAIEWSQRLRPDRTTDVHIDHAAAAVSSLLGNCPDQWLNAALERAAAQAGVEAA